jgi:pilus assembly protein Flp/PilA
MIMLKKLLMEEEGAQIIECSLIIAMISVALVLALQPNIFTAGMAVVIERISNCMAGACV